MLYIIIYCSRTFFCLRICAKTNCKNSNYNLCIFYISGLIKGGGRGDKVLTEAICGKVTSGIVVILLFGMMSYHDCAKYWLIFFF